MPKLKYTKAETTDTLDQLELKEITILFGKTRETKHTSLAYVSPDGSYCVLPHHDLMIPRPSKGLLLPLYGGLVALLEDTYHDTLELHPEIWKEYKKDKVITRDGYLRKTDIRQKSFIC